MTKSKTKQKKRQSVSRNKGQGWLVFGVLVLLVGSVVMAADGLVDGRLTLSGEEVQEEREVSEFNRISFRGMGEMVIMQAEETSVHVTTDSELMDSIEVEVANGVLLIGFDRKGSFWRSVKLGVSDIVFTIHTPAVTEIVSSGATRIMTSGTGITGESLKTSLSGASQAIMHLDVDGFEADSSGSGKFIITGDVGEQTVDLSGASKYFAKNATSSTAAVSASGSSEIELNVTDELTVNTSGAGVLRYRGEPTINSTGSGTLSISKIID